MSDGKSDTNALVTAGIPDSIPVNSAKHATYVHTNENSMAFLLSFLASSADAATSLISGSSSIDEIFDTSCGSSAYFAATEEIFDSFMGVYGKNPFWKERVFVG